MSQPAFEHLDVERRRRFQWKKRLWRERCFGQVLWRHFSLRALIMIIILTGGATLFKYLGGDPTIPFQESLWHTWLLIFGEPPPGDYPESLVLDIMYFLMPILGLTVIIEGIIDFSLTVRDRKRYERSWCEMMASSMKNHIVLVGFGRLGFSAYELLRKLGEAVVIERDPENQFLEELRRDNVPLIIGDARREALLEDANIGEARSIIIATDDDLANLEIALDARRIKPGMRVVLRMFDQNMATKVGDGFHINLAMSQSAVSAPAFAMPAVDGSIVQSFVVGDELIVMQRWQCRSDGPLCGKTVSQIMHAYGVSIVRQLRPGEKADQIFPQPETLIEEGDDLLVQGRYDVLKKLTELATPV